LQLAKVCGEDDEKRKIAMDVSEGLEYVQVRV
jgi:hypothetical protein